MRDDTELLRSYVDQRSDEAFAELVQRHVNLVHSVALRQVNGDAHLAADVTQCVFTDLARKARALVHHRVLAGWLFTSTRFAAAKAVRTEQRRHAREQEAHLMQELCRDPAATLEWERVRPVLDEVIAELGDADREAILLRYFEGRDFAGVGAKLALNANTARMRVERALDKLRARLERRGVTSTSAALAAVLAQQAVAAAPAGLATLVAGAAVAGGASALTTTAATTGAAVAGATGFMAMTKLQIGLAGAIAVAGASGYVAQAETEATLHRELAALQQQNVEIRTLRDENARLARAVAEIQELRNDDTELSRLRDESVVLKTRLDRVAIQQRAQAANANTGGRSVVSGPVYDISQLDRQPVPRFQARPQYPVELRTAGIGGEALVDFVVDTEGNVVNATAVRSSRREFEEPAVTAVSKWKFKPGEKNQQIVNTHMQVPIVFTVSK
jgi:RNA polymerase sigma factor (sigma-70 family)